MNTNIVAMPQTPAHKQNLIGTVMHVNDNKQVIVKCNHGVVNATLTFSCLVRPEIEDKVLLADCEGEFYLTSIISREEKASTMAFEGDLNLTTKGNINISSAEQHIVAGRHSITSSDIDIKGNELNLIMKQSKMQCDTTTMSGKNFYQRMEQIVRWVDKLETVNINNWIQNIRNTLSSRSKNAVITAKGDMKIDAERIHMG